MSAEIAYQSSNKSVKSNQFDQSTLSEQALLDEFCRDFLPGNDDFDNSATVDDSDFTLRSAASVGTLRSVNTTRSIGTDDGSKDLVLKWSTKEQLITILNEYTAILHGKAPNDEQRILKETNKFLQTLSCLPLKLKETIKEGWNQMSEMKIDIEKASSAATKNGTDFFGNCVFCNRLLPKEDGTIKNCSNCNKPAYCDSECETEGQQFHAEDCKSRLAAESSIEEGNAEKRLKRSKAKDELVVDLKWKAQSKIVQTLTTNQSFAIHNSRYISAESKRDLVRKNNLLIQLLLGLQVRLVDGESIDYLFPDEQPEGER